MEESNVCMNKVISLQTRKISVSKVGSGPRDDHQDGQQCRICLTSGESDNQLISPCGCTGSVQYIHANCYHTWIYKKYQNPATREQILGPQGLKCEICHTKYIFNYQIAQQLASYQCFKRKISANKLLAMMTISFILIDMVLMSVVSWFISSDHSNPSFNLSEPRYFLAYIALIFTICSLFFGLYQFTKIFLITNKFKLINDLQVNQLAKIKLIKKLSTANMNDNIPM